MLPAGAGADPHGRVAQLHEPGPQTGPGRPVLQLPPKPGRGNPRSQKRRAVRVDPVVYRHRDEPGGSPRLRGAQADAQPAGQGDHHVGRPGDFRDHPPPAVRLGRDAGRRRARAATAYADWAVEHAQELSGINADTAYEQFQAAYPFHPSVLSVFQRKWQSLPRFQRTRGVLRLLALWVAHAYQEEHRKAQRRAAHHARAGSVREPELPHRVVRAAWFVGAGNPRHDGHRGPGRRPCRPAGQGGRRGDPQGPVAPQGRHDHLLRVERRHVPVEGRGDRCRRSARASAGRT